MSARRREEAETARDRWLRKDGRPASPAWRSIWETVCRIPPGRVATYGQIARLAGQAGQPRQVGYALHLLPEGSGAPWHRVINARGTISTRSGWMPGEEHKLQRALLEREGVRFDSWGRVDLSQYQWKPRARSQRTPRK